MQGNAADALLWAVRADGGSALPPTPPAAWSKLLDAADFHGLAPLIYSKVARLVKAGNDRAFQEAAIPEYVLDRLRLEYVDSTKRNLVLTAALLTIIGELSDASIPLIPLKGPALAEALYDDPALRPSADLDLMIRADDLPAALSTLERIGYALRPNFAALPWQTLLALNCEVVVSGPGGLPVELQWAIAPDDYPFRFDADILWRSRRRVRFAGHDIDVLAPETLLLYLTVHGAKHAWSRLLWLGDIARVIERGIDWNRALELATEARCRRPVFLGLLLARDLLEAAVPQHVVEQAQSDPVIVAAAVETERRLQRMPPVEPSSTARTAYNAKLTTSVREKVRHWAAMFKAPKDQDIDQWNLPPGLFFLYYPLRVGRLAAKYARRLARIWWPN